jgi:hypothetical protein
MPVSREGADRPALHADESVERRHEDRRATARALLGSGLVSGVVVVAYFLLPLSSSLTDNDTTLVLAAGLLVIAALLWWHVRSILRSPHPVLRAVTALATTVPVFLTLFAGTYFVMSTIAPAQFSEPLSRLDAVYYTVTIFATVGFGDITPVSAPARATATLQMVGDIILVGLVVQVIVGAMRKGLQRKEGEATAEAAEVPRDSR